MRSSTPAQTLRAHLGMALQTLLVGPGFTFSQYAAKNFPPLVLLLLRLSFAALLLLPLFVYTGGFKTFKPTRRQWIGIVSLVFVGMLANQLLFMVGLRYTTPASSALLYALTPLIVLALSVFLFRSERLTFWKTTGILLALLGVGIIFFEKGYALAADRTLGNLITLAAVCCWALYLTYSRKLFQNLNAFQTTSFMMMLAAVIYLPFGITQLPGMDWQTVPAHAWFGLAYMVVVNSILGYLLVTYGLSHLPASQVSVYINLQPVTATLFSVLVVHEPLTAGFVLGGLVILLGIYLVNRAALAEQAAAIAAREEAVR
jgi:drug/metabolite transporter (DMT)-like permease